MNKGWLQGQGLTAHPNLKEAAINEDVKAVINTKSAPDDKDFLIHKGYDYL